MGSLLKNRKLILVFFSIIAIILFLYLSNPYNLIASIKTFNIFYLPIILSLSLINYFFRYLRWEILLKSADIKIEREKSILIFLSGFVMTITPAKIGEAIKSFYLKKIGIKYRKSLPVVIAERFYDLFGMLILLVISSSFLFLNNSSFYFIFVIVLIFIFSIIFSEKIIGLIIKFIKKIKIKSFDKIEESSVYLNRMFERKTSIYNISLSVFGWFMECIGLMFTLKGFGINFEIMRETFIYSFSSLIGIISMLPGGLGVTEGGLSGLLNKIAEIPISYASSSTLVIRFATIWFAFIIGYFANLYMKNNYKK